MTAKIEIDYQRLEDFLSFKPTLYVTAAKFGCSEDTLQARIREKYDMTFTQLREKCLDKTRLALQQKAIQLALHGNPTMMIFALKNLCGWSDKIEQKTEISGKAIEINYTVAS